MGKKKDKQTCGRCGESFGRLYQHDGEYVCAECCEAVTGETPLMTQARDAAEVGAETARRFKSTSGVVNAVLGGDRIKRLTSTLELACKLSDFELLEAGSGLSQKLSEMAQHELNLSRIKADYKALTEGCNTEIARLANLVRTRSEMRLTPITTTYDYAAGTVVVVRTDTFEQVSKRLMFDWERQAELPGVEMGGEVIDPETGEIVRQGGA